MLALFAVVGGLAALDFNAAFKVFHAIFFPGKDNWLFNSRTDAIINAMPQDFFMNCAMLILGSVVVCSVGLLVYGLLHKDRQE